MSVDALLYLVYCLHLTAQSAECRCHARGRTGLPYTRPLLTWPDMCSLPAGRTRGCTRCAVADTWTCSIRDTRAAPGTRQSSSPPDSTAPSTRHRPRSGQWSMVIHPVSASAVLAWCPAVLVINAVIRFEFSGLQQCCVLSTILQVIYLYHCIFSLLKFMPVVHQCSQCTPTLG